MAKLSQSNTDFYGNPILKDEGGAYKVLPNGMKDYSAYQDTDPSMPYEEAREQYENKLREKGSPDWKGGGTAAARAAVTGGSGADILSAGLIGTGDPVAIGAGLGLAALSSGKKARQARRMQEYENAVAKANQRRSSIENLANIGERLSV